MAGKLKHFLSVLRAQLLAGFKDFAITSILELLMWVFFAVCTFLVFGFWCKWGPSC